MPSRGVPISGFGGLPVVSSDTGGLGRRFWAVRGVRVEDGGCIDHYWGAQTQGSLVHFDIGDDRMPKAVYHAYGYVKKAAATVNGRAGRLPPWKSDLIVRVADEVIAAKLDDEFPLYVWQTGSGRSPT